jgi:hypothetical protein
LDKTFQGGKNTIGTASETLYDALQEYKEAAKNKGVKLPDEATAKKIIRLAHMETILKEDEFKAATTEIAKLKRDIYQAAGKDKQAQTFISEVQKALSEELKAHIINNLGPDKKIYQAIRDKLSSLRPKSLFEGENIAGTLANVRLDHKINRQFAKDALLFDRPPKEKEHSYGQTELAPSSTDTSYVKADNIIHPSGKINQIIQFPSETSSSEKGAYEDIGIKLQKMNAAEIAMQLKKVLKGQGNSAYFNTLGSLLFATETVRNPGALISNVIYLEELSRGRSKLNIKNIANDLPMGFSGAVEGSRGLHQVLMPYLKHRTYYDYGTFNYPKEDKKNEEHLKILKAKDTILMLGWLEHNKIIDPLDKKLLDYRKSLEAGISQKSLENLKEKDIKEGKQALTELFIDEANYLKIKNGLKQVVKDWYGLDIEFNLPALRHGQKLAEEKDKQSGQEEEKAQGSKENKGNSKGINSAQKLAEEWLDSQNAFNRREDQDYWLQDRDLKTIIKSKKGEGKFPDNVKDCVILPVFGSEPSNNIKLLIEGLKENESLVGLANHRTHWTAFKIFKDNDGRLSCWFMDSLLDKQDDEFNKNLKSDKRGADKKIAGLKNEESKILMVSDSAYKVSKDKEGNLHYQSFESQPWMPCLKFLKTV